MKPASEVTALVIDTGIFLHVARRCAREFKKVYYWTPWETSFPRLKDSVIGDGYPDLIATESIEGVKDECDLFIFPDIGYADLQMELIGMGKAVWGARHADELEALRGKFLDVLKTTNLPVPKFKKVKGLTSLKMFLKEKENQFIKVSTYRGDFETFHFRSMGQDENVIDKWAVTLGPLKEMMSFFVFEPIESIIEDGIDTYCIDGQWPKTIIHGVECKDSAYIGAFQKMEDAPKEIRVINEEFGPVLARYGYRGAFSTEGRITEEGETFFIDPTCFSDDTEVLTEKGWKLFQNLNRNDKVATTTMDGRIEYQQPDGYVRKPFNGEMVLITNDKKTIECLITPDHNVLRTGRHGGGMCLQPAKDLSDKGYIPRTGKWHGEEPQFFQIPEYRHSWLSGRWMKCFKEKHCEPLAVDIGTMLRFMGYYLSEGCIGGGGWLVSISQFKYKKEMLEALRVFPIQPRENDNGFQFHSVQLVKYCEQFGTCSEKFVPDWIKRLSPELINIFLDACTLGDGSVQSGSRTIYTTSRQMADDLQELFFKAGSVASIFEKLTAGTSMTADGRTYIRNHNIFHVCETKTFNRFWFETGKRKSRYIKSVEYVGDVYCVSVPNRTLYVRRNGKPFWSGNCRFPSPPSQCMCEMIGNLGEIIWQGANGILVEPVHAFKFGAQAIFKVDRDEWSVFEISDELDPWVKISFSCRVDGRICVPPDPMGVEEIGWVVGCGDTIEEAIANLKEHVDEMPDGCNVQFSSIADLLKSIHDAEDEGMHLTEQTVPEPASVIE